MRASISSARASASASPGGTRIPSRPFSTGFGDPGVAVATMISPARHRLHEHAPGAVRASGRSRRRPRAAGRRDPRDRAHEARRVWRCRALRAPRARGRQPPAPAIAAENERPRRRSAVASALISVAWLPLPSSIRLEAHPQRPERPGGEPLTPALGAARFGVVVRPVDAHRGTTPHASRGVGSHEREPSPRAGRGSRSRPGPHARGPLRGPPRP